MEEKKSVLTDEDKREINLAVMTQNTSVMNPVEHEQMKKMADEYWKSGALSDAFQNVNQVIMAVNAGREMGMGFVESLNGLYFVGGKLNIYGKATPSALRRHGWRIEYSNETGDSCTATVTNERTGETITDTFTFEEAKLSGFVSDRSGKIKVGWKQGANRKRKLRYGVLSQIIHTYIPEVISGVNGIGEYSQDYIESQPKGRIQVFEEETINDAKAELASAKNLDELRDKYAELTKKDAPLARELAGFKDELKEKFE